MSGRRILIAEPQGFPQEAIELLAEAGAVELGPCSRSELIDAFTAFDAVWIRLGHAIDLEVIGAAPRCRHLAVPTTGLDHVDLDACAAAGIEVVSLRGETEFLRDVRATAELTVGLVLALLRRIPAAHRHVLDGGWDRDQFVGTELHGRAAGIVGVGRLGTIVASYLEAFGMDVAGYDPRPDFPDGVKRVDDLGELLSRSDVVSLHVSHDASTHHLIGPNELDSFREGAVLINTSRGGVVDEASLVGALRSGRLAGVGVDVVDGEPATSLSPLVEYARDHDTVLITPHLGGNTVESARKTNLFIAGRLCDAMVRSGRT